MRDTDYATEIATADIDGQRIERIFVKEQNQEEIRFSWWPDGKMIVRPLDLPESDLLSLIQKAVVKGVFTDSFLDGLRDFLVRRRDHA